jgi:uncharacterized alkaline shock family protein YloU
MTELKIDSPGQVRIADDALAVIAGTAALEADGVAGLTGNALGRKQLSKGVAITVEGETLTASVEIAVKPGVKIQEVSKDVQLRVKNAIETMTGLTVNEVNVSVSTQMPERQTKTA